MSMKINYGKVSVQWKDKVKSLKLLIIVVIMIMGNAGLFICGKSLIYSYRNKSVNNRAIEIKSQCNMLSTDIADSDFFTNTSNENINSMLAQITYAYSARVMVVNKEFVIVKDTYKTEEGRTIISKNVIETYQGNPVTYVDTKTGYIDISVPVYDMDGKTIIGVVNMVMTDMETFNMCEYLKSVFIAIDITVGLVCLTVAVLFAHLTVKPLYRLAESIKTFAYGLKSEHIENRTLYEYNRVADAVNITLDKIRMVDESRDEFVSNVSHELKTPMTSMKVLADSLVSQQDVPVELYREFMEDIVNEIDRENKVINDLLELVKLDRANAELNLSTVNVNEFVELVLKRLGPIAKKKNVELVLESFRPFAAEIDEVKLTLAVSNLVENAIKYNNEGGWVRVSINADYKYFYIRVADSGIGISQEAIEQIFNRFYRVDKARSRQTGGTGLGLAITKSIVLMHKGTIKVYSKEEEGTIFTVRIPIYHGGEA